MPLITRRSSTRGLPRVSVGRWGFDARELLVRKPETIPIHERPPDGGRESQNCSSPNPFMGPDPSMVKSSRMSYAG